MKELLGTKTFWTAAGAVVCAVGCAVFGTISWTECFAAVFAAVQSVNIRHAIAKQ